MTARYLTRINPDANMARYYKLDVQPDLFGSWSFIREWGRIGRPGQVRHMTFSTANEAQAALARQWCKKSKRGYEPPGVSS